MNGRSGARDDLEAALADFRRWFAEAADGPDGPPAAEAPGLDLATLLGHFVALRQEVNLQTRAVRAQQEQTAEAVQRLQQALELAQRGQARAEQLERTAENERLRPLLSTLADLYDSLATAAGPIRRVTAGVLPQLEGMLDGGAGEEPGGAGDEAGGEARPARSFWSRWILSPSAEAALQAGREETRRARAWLRRDREERRRRGEQIAGACRQVGDALSTLLAGYTMSLERLERSLRKHGLEPIAALGEPFDPERMEVLEGVAGTGRPAGEVVEELQRGYTHNGRVFRYARVRVARG